MKRVMLLLMLIATLSIAGGGEEAFMEQMEEQSSFEIIKDWRTLAVGALGLSIVLVAIAYAIGIGFEMPEIKAWAGTELTQIVANAIIIIALVACIALIDVVVIAMVESSGLDIAECDPLGGGDTEYGSCLQAVTTFYLSDYVSTAKGSMKSILVENVKKVNSMNTRFGLYCNSIYCAQIGISFTYAADYILDSDMYTLLFEYYTNLLAFMEAQLFFVNEISFKIGPVLLAIGIVARSFYFTRKVGGLLIAVALGITFFFPGMYLFDWVTLDMAVTGDKGLDTQKSECPAECMKRIPIAYYVSGSTTYYFNQTPDLWPMFDADEQDKAEAIALGTVASYYGTNGSADGKEIISCEYHANKSGTYCDSMCRSLPYPITAQCTDVEVQKACADMPSKCKVIREVPGVEGTPEYEECPDICKVVPPLENNCDICEDNDEDKCCLDSPTDCRIARRDNAGELDEEWRPTMAGSDDDTKKAKSCKKAKYCPADEDAYDSCVYVIPQVDLCDTLCVGCPAHCRVEDGDLENMDADCDTSACDDCHPTCFVDIDDIEDLDPPAGECENCPAERRLLGASMPDNYTDGNCSYDACSAEYRAFLPRSACEACVFSEESYIYDPPINNQCDDLCKPSNDIPMKDAAEYSKIGEDGLVGKAEIQSVAKLMLPVYVLPLFNIVATLIFIKGMSRILGGDIEIPGISKVF